MSFSDRLGLTTPKTILQKDSIDEALRNGLWNVVTRDYIGFLEYDMLDDRRTDYYYDKYYEIFTRFFKLPADSMGPRDKNRYHFVRDWFFKAKWFEVYNFIEFLANNSASFSNEFNKIFEAEKSAYRFIGGTISPITDDIEINTINSIQNSPYRFSGARAHISRSLEAFSRRPQGDYLTAIKEAISAVESCCKVISNKDNATLGDALKEMEKSKTMHSAFKESFLKLYGYASDEKGIRHALLDDKVRVDEADAHFMIVVCSAFLNFSIQRYSE